MAVFKDNLGQHADFMAVLRYRPEVLDGVIVQNNPVNSVDPSGLYSLQQGLSDTANYSWVAGAASTFVPGGQTAAIAFAGIGTVATVAERIFYPTDPVDPYLDLLKASTPVPGGPFMDKFKENLIDSAYGAYKRDEARAKGCNQ